MRLRITLSFVAVLALAIGLAGIVTLKLVHDAQSRALQQSVERDARTLITAVKANSTGKDISKQDVFNVIEHIAGVKLEVIGVDAKDNITSQVPIDLPISVLESNNGGQRLTKGQIISGVHDGIAYSAGPLIQTEGATVAFLFEARVPLSSGLYFLIAGLVALAVSALLAAVISRGIAVRVVRVVRASEQIAAGDLDVRLTGSNRGYPEIAELDQSINTMAAELARAQRQERSFLLSISHDLRTPLTSIRGYAEAIADGAVESPQRAANIVLSEATRLERLIGDLLDLARLRAEQFTFTPSTVDLVEMAVGAADALRVAFDGVGVALSVDGTDHPIYVEVDPHRVAQIVSNLLENALKYASSAVAVAVTEGEGRAGIAVEDDGPGIDPEDLPHVLERLFTSDRHQARSSGTGLGLAIVSELAAAMGGTIAIDSPTRPDGGTTITVDFPRTAAPLRADDISG